MSIFGKRRASGPLAAIALATVLAGACSDATDVELLEIGGEGVLVGQAFFDADADGVLTLADSPLVNIDVQVLTATSGQIVRVATTDSLGVFAVLDIPVGSYRLDVASLTGGDSLSVVGGATPILIELGDTSQVTVGVSYPVLALEEVLVAQVGSRVATSGIALNQRLNFDPTGQVHFVGDSLYLRALNVERSGVAPGDSVRLVGRVVVDNGRVALDDVTPFRLVPQAAFVVPVDVSVAQGETAGGGSLDAALVRLRDVEITDTSTAVDGHFRFWGVSNADSIEIVLRSFLGFATSVVRPDTTIRIDEAVGLLTPYDAGGSVSWRLLPRGGQDLILETRTADLSVTAVLDTAQASLGDTVTITVVASNAGPLAATAVSLQDTIPTAMTFVSSAPTRGVYDSGTGVWSIGDLGVGSSDTLVVQMEVTDGTPANIGHVAQLLGLTREVDPNGADNGVVVFLTIS